MTWKPLTAILMASAMLVPAAARAEEHDRVGTVVRKAMHEGEPIVTDADRAMIRAKCGLPAGAEVNNINFNEGALKCQDGRTVKDAETQEMSHRIAQRARAKVDAVMSRPDVRAAMSGETQARAREAMAHAREQIERTRIRLAHMDHAGPGMERAREALERAEIRLRHMDDGGRANEHVRKAMERVRVRMNHIDGSND